MRATFSSASAGSRCRSARHQSTSSTQSLFERNRRPETEQPFGLIGRGQPSRHRIDRSFRGKLRIDFLAAHRPGKSLRQLQEARLGATRDVEDLIACGRLCAQYIGARDVANMDEIHGLPPVAKDYRRLTRFEAVPSSGSAPRCIGRKCPCAVRTH